MGYPGATTVSGMGSGEARLTKGWLQRLQTLPAACKGMGYLAAAQLFACYVARGASPDCCNFTFSFQPQFCVLFAPQLYLL